MKAFLRGAVVGLVLGCGGGAFAAWTVRPVYDSVATQWKTVQTITSNPLKTLQQK